MQFISSRTTCPSQYPSLSISFHSISYYLVATSRIAKAQRSTGGSAAAEAAAPLPEELPPPLPPGPPPGLPPGGALPAAGGGSWAAAGDDDRSGGGGWGQGESGGWGATPAAGESCGWGGTPAAGESGGWGVGGAAEPPPPPPAAAPKIAFSGAGPGKSGGTQSSGQKVCGSGIAGCCKRNRSTVRGGLSLSQACTHARTQTFAFPPARTFTHTRRPYTDRKTERRRGERDIARDGEGEGGRRGTMHVGHCS